MSLPLPPSVRRAPSRSGIISFCRLVARRRKQQQQKLGFESRKSLMQARNLLMRSRHGERMTPCCVVGLRASIKCNLWNPAGTTALPFKAVSYTCNPFSTGLRLRAWDSIFCLPPRGSGAGRVEQCTRHEQVAERGWGVYKI